MSTSFHRCTLRNTCSSTPPASSGSSSGQTAQVEEFDLARFVDAQEQDGTFERAMREVAQGRKVSHWMWFVYPQLAGLGTSPTARFYAISGLDEARAYLAHPVLGERIRVAARVAAQVERRSAEEVFGSVDADKLRSSMTLFGAADPSEPAFQSVLDRYFAGQADQLSLRLLGAG
ncbi:MAG: DUF1810 domain-containing protein [Actinobacteria bacterium]|nr:DUF1810 domain-containing protein [Actinomycetota bacterium]